MIDPERPCDSKNRKKNRYTKEELMRIAASLSHPPSNLNKMTMDSLCAFLKRVPKTPHKPTPTSPPLNKCALEDRPCDSKSRKPNRYKKTELVRLWESSCQYLSSAQKKPKTIDDYCRAISQISVKSPALVVAKKKTPTPTPVKKARIKIARFISKKLKERKTLETTPFKNIQEKARLKIVRFIEKNWKKMEKTPIEREVPHYKRFDFSLLDVHLPRPKRIPKQVSNTLKKLIGKFEKNNLDVGYNPQTISASCYEGPRFYIEDQNLQEHARDPKALINRNLTIDNFELIEIWAENQAQYMESLSWEDKIIVFCYTYGGDRMVNSLLLNQDISSTKVIPPKTTDNNSPYARFLTCAIYPLALFLFLEAKSFKTAETFSNAHGPIPEYFRQRLISLWNEIQGGNKNTTFSQTYERIFHFYVDNRDVFPIEILMDYIIAFKNRLEHIIKNAPKTNVQFWLYRGISKKDYVVVGHHKRFVFQNVPFMSTSLNICKSSRFKDKGSNCCIQQILVPKGVACLFISMISSFPDEEEIVFSPGSYLYPLTDDFIATNIDVDTRKFLIAN